MAAKSRPLLRFLPVAEAPLVRYRDHDGRRTRLAGYENAVGFGRRVLCGRSYRRDLMAAAPNGSRSTGAMKDLDFRDGQRGAAAFLRSKPSTMHTRMVRHEIG